MFETISSCAMGTALATAHRRAREAANWKRMEELDGQMRLLRDACGCASFIGFHNNESGWINVSGKMGRPYEKDLFKVG